jgi:outer membrane protein OmpA-like peptidoglycan-associated protein
MKKSIIISLLALSMTTSANAGTIDSLFQATVDNPNLQRLTPTLMTDYVQLGKANQHWFIGVQGGASAFIGNPVGCGDLFDRITPSFNAYVGKWFTPNVAMRLAFQGFKYKNSNLDKVNYQLGHADLMYNMANLFRQPSERLPKWDFAPYIGAGLVHGADLSYTDEGKARNFLFALIYGIHSRYHIGQRFYISGELGGFTTFRDFDGYGSHGKLCDNMPSVSLGIGFNLGTPRWKHAIDANPYINQNDYLLSYVDRLEQSNKLLNDQHNIDQKTLEELKKILEIEGLLDKYGYLFGDNSNARNNYRGLLSLRSRLRGMNEPTMPSALETKPNVLNIPIYFFFELGKAKLTDDSQLINLDELAKVAIEHNLKVHIAGAADSATGSENGNSELSKERTRYIAQELKKRGVPNERMKGVSLGGIQEFNNPKDNRFSKVSLYLELDSEQLNY